MDDRQEETAPERQVQADGRARFRSETSPEPDRTDRLSVVRRTDRVIRDIPIDRIKEDELVRDRAVIDRAELNELRASIVRSGLRMPIEVVELKDENSEFDFGLISGYLRLMAFREAFEITGLDQYRTIMATVRTPGSVGQDVAAMVEENEIRCDLSPYERGRIAALSAQAGLFTNVEAAVADLFSFASKAKRSKIRAFARLYEDLGDAMTFAEDLSERRGLALASALRGGAEAGLREALASRKPASPDEEWALVAPLVERFREAPPDPARGGRPRQGRTSAPLEKVVTGRGVSITWQPVASGGYRLRLTGSVSSDEMTAIVEMMRTQLDSDPDEFDNLCHS